jgi:hypothetical protein
MQTPSTRSLFHPLMLLIDSLAEAWRARRASRRLRREVEPEVFARLAVEIRELALTAASTCPGAMGIPALTSDIDELTRTVGTPEFSRLSVERRLLLRQGLIKSRQQLIASLQGAARPTRYPQ